jgi:hypothetical protein
MKPVRAAGKFTIPMVTSARATKVVLLVSYDDGATWRSVKVDKTAAGRFTSEIKNPSPGYVSFKVTASGGGSSVTQTVIRAYQVS